MVKLKDLQASKERVVREIVQTPTGTINIFEPNVEDFDKILTVQREKGVKDGDTVDFDGAVVIREIFPILTDLELGELTDEEIEEILAEPSIYLLATQNYVSQIITEINSLFMQRIKTELMQASAIVDQAKIVSSIPKIIAKEAERQGNDEILEKMEAITGNLKTEAKGWLNGCIWNS